MGAQFVLIYSLDFLFVDFIHTPVHRFAASTLFSDRNSRACCCVFRVNP